MLKWVQKNSLATVALFAYVVMAAMLVAQARIIESQRTLIRQLYGDSLELSARKMHDVQVKNAK